MAVDDGSEVALPVFGLGNTARVLGLCCLCLLGGWIVLNSVSMSMAVSSEVVGARETIASSGVVEAAGLFSTVLRDIFQSYTQVSRYGKEVYEEK